MLGLKGQERVLEIDKVSGAARIQAGVPAPPGAPEPERASHRLPDGGYEIRADQEETTKLVHDLTAWALESGFVLEALEVTPPTLEDVYLELTATEDVTA